MIRLIEQLESFVEKASQPGVLGLPGRKVEKRATTELSHYFSQLAEKVRQASLEKMYNHFPTDGRALTKMEKDSLRNSTANAMYNALRVLRPNLTLILKSNMLDAISAARKHNYAIKEADKKGSSLFDAVQWAEDQAADLIADLDDTTIDQISAAIASGIDDQLGVDGTARLLRDTMEDMTTSRARTIASTEMNRAMSHAAVEQLGEFDIEYKQIILSPDACEICQDIADDGPIPIDDEFSSGDDYPPFHPNCRCAVTGARNPDEESSPRRRTMFDNIVERDFSADKRKELAKSGAALPDGSFPIETKADLENAIKAVGRASDPSAAKAHIKKRAKALGCTDCLPDNWESWVKVGTDELISEASIEQTLAMSEDAEMDEDDSTGENVTSINGHMDAADYHDAKGANDAHPRADLHKAAATHHRDAAVRGGAKDDPAKSKEARQASMCANGNCDCPQHMGESVKEAIFKSSDSHDGLRSKLSQAIDGKVMGGEDMDGDNDGAQDAKERKEAGYPSHYVRDVHDNHVIYSMGGKTFAHQYTKDSDGDPHLKGKPVEVEPSYSTVKKSQASDDDGSSSLSAESYQLEESCAFDTGTATDKVEVLKESFGTDGDFTFTVIKPGWSKNNRYYSPDMLKRDYKVFEGAKMFIDHATDKQEAARPEGSIRDWAANVTKVWPESDGTIKATGKVIDPQLRGKMEALKNAGMLNTMGVSIRAMGTGKQGEVEGKKGKIVECLKAAKSVDFVTFAGAGGAVEQLS